MFEFNLAEAFVNVILNAVKSEKENVKIGSKRIEKNETMNMVEITVTIDYSLIKFISVGQTLNIFIGDNGENKVVISIDDNEFDIAEKILAKLS